MTGIDYFSNPFMGNYENPIAILSHSHYNNYHWVFLGKPRLLSVRVTAATEVCNLEFYLQW